MRSQQVKSSRAMPEDAVLAHGAEAFFAGIEAATNAEPPEGWLVVYGRFVTSLGIDVGSSDGLAECFAGGFMAGRGDRGATGTEAADAWCAWLAESGVILERELIPNASEAKWSRRVPGGPLDLGSLRPRVGRNEPCPCGSGRKSKRCCAGVVT